MRLTLGLVFLALTVSSAVQARSRVITAPVWKRQPTNEMLWAAVTREFRVPVAARVAMSCRAHADGTLSACRVMSEEPKGYNFAGPALESASLYQLDTAHYGDVAGAEVRFSMEFRFR